MTDLLVYGKIIIDDIRLESGEIVREVLGGGGPQGAFGARLWHPSVGLLTRSGVDMPSRIREDLEYIDVDLSGWVQYDDLPTPRGLMAYDDNQYMLGDVRIKKRNELSLNKMGEMLARDIPIPEQFQHPKLIHLITEYTLETMADEALKMKEAGAIYSLEPIIDYRQWSNKEKMMAYFPKVDVITPDWPSASGMAGSDDPIKVLKFWKRFNTDLVAVRDGMRGSYVWEKNRDQMWHIPIVKINAVDPTGCGNAYGGGLAANWAINHDGKIAGCCGTVSASFLAETVGVPRITKPMEELAKKRLEQMIDEVVSM
jgi:sugar/nucleoside kinase (ribokinase family)